MVRISTADVDAGRDPFTAVVVAFYEHIPQSKVARADMHRWFTRSQVLEGRQAFSRNITLEESDELLATFDQLASKWKKRASERA